MLGITGRKPASVDLTRLHENARTMSVPQWCDFWMEAAADGGAGSPDIPPFPDAELQEITNSLSGIATMRGACRFYRVLCEEIPSVLPACFDRKVLDFGAGWGRITRLMLQLSPPERLYAVDVDKRLVKAGRRCLPDVNFVQVTGGAALPFEDGEFDILVANSVFSHLSENLHRFYVDELARVLRPGGVIFATTLAREHMNAWYANPNTQRWISELLGDQARANGVLDRAEFLFGEARRYVRPARVWQFPRLRGYGIAIIPEGWVAEAWARNFDLLKTRTDLSQELQVAIRR